MKKRESSRVVLRMTVAIKQHSLPLFYLNKYFLSQQAK